MKVEVDLGQVTVQIPKELPKKEMMTVTERNGKTIVSINSSSLSLLQTCMRKTDLIINQNWTTQTDSPALVYGLAIHKALEFYYLADPELRKLPVNFMTQAEMIGAGHKYDGNNIPLQSIQQFAIAGKALSAFDDANKRSIPTGAWTLAHYFKTYENDPYVVYSDDDGPFVERTFRCALYGSPEIEISYFGTIDLILQHLETKQILVTDHKTTSVMGNDFFNRLKPNHQYSGYLWGAIEAFGIVTNEFLINGIQVKTKPLTKRGGPPNFIHQVTSRDDDDFIEFRHAVIEAVSRYMGCKNLQQWPQGHVDTCAMYGGCQFLQVCSAPKKIRDNILQARFQR